jgi:Uncharacterized protein conserved in bacteria
LTGRPCDPPPGDATGIDPLNRSTAHFVLSSTGDSRHWSTRRDTTVRFRTPLLLAATVVGVTLLAGCSMGAGGSGYGNSGSPSTSPSSSSSSSSGSNASGSDVLSTVTNKLGTIVVDGKGMTIYVYDQDTKGATTSACTGACATMWPAVTTTSAKPSAMGVTGTIGTIAGPGGKHQVTLNGLPLYTYSGDSAAGDVTGQGLQGTWWAVSPDGTKITGNGMGY